MKSGGSLCRCAGRAGNAGQLSLTPYFDPECKIEVNHRKAEAMAPQNNALTIGRAAKQAGVGVETIRFYERKGLITRPPRPAAGGFRDYPASTLARIRFIREAQELGFSLGEIAELLALRADPRANCRNVQRRAEAKRAEVKRKVARLEAIGRALDRLIAACPGKGALGTCSILDALQGADRVATKPRPKNERKKTHGHEAKN